MQHFSQKKYAYVTVLTSQNYLAGIRTLLFSLNKVKSSYPLVVLVPAGFDQQCQQTMKAWGASVEVVDDIDLGDLAQKQVRAYWNNTFLKLRVFDLIQFDKIIYVDSDMIVLKTSIIYLKKNTYPPYKAES